MDRERNRDGGGNKNSSGVQTKIHALCHSPCDSFVSFFFPEVVGDRDMGIDNGVRTRLVKRLQTEDLGGLSLHCCVTIKCTRMTYADACLHWPYSPSKTAARSFAFALALSVSFGYHDHSLLAIQPSFRQRKWLLLPQNCSNFGGHLASLRQRPVPSPVSWRLTSQVSRLTTQVWIWEGHVAMQKDGSPLILGLVL